MYMRIASVLVILSSLMAGCASSQSQSDDAILEQAVLEREAAYVRVAKAITHYCSVTHHTLDSRQACILEHRLPLLQIQ